MRLPHLIVTPRLIAKIFSGLALAVLAGYFLFQLSPALRVPRLELDSPQGNSVVTVPEFTLKGKTDRGARLTVNLEEVYVDGEGNFERPMYLSSGTNVIDITLEGKFGRETHMTRYIIYKDPKYEASRMEN